ncbi:hypothetical protein C1752_10486 [Acaryochloris thomasi RCC1774]|uniref:Uncharacterized protein n=1 Tax=Acaryochloris thomasi RCC1774 TaxID=1764569 RepID=A0A2W1J966_9CYAN|nr:hypothetical protein [Acaryochloris thomasi]PZD70636.1 hypothetical protein C1752_10486 [Acaryochloris thomasi RCC1774]
MTPQDFIQAEGIENVLTAAIEHAEIKAMLYGSLGDTDNYRYWVKVWWSLASACDRMITDFDTDEALSAWQEHQGLRSEI